MTLRAFLSEHPIPAGLALLLVAGLFRLLDIFVFRLDERWGEIIVSKLVASALLVGFLSATGAGLTGAGFHSRGLKASLALGVGLTVAALSLGYLADFVVGMRKGGPTDVHFTAIDPKTGLAGAAAFGTLLIVGNLVNSFAEEGLFRGALIPLFSREFDPWLALGLSAGLFGAWHLPWALKAVTGGTGADVTGVAVANFLPQALLGVVWGYLYMRTGNLWGSWAAHTLTNSAVNFVHIRTSEGLDTGLSVRMTIFTIVMLLGMLVIWDVSNRYQLARVQPWSFTP